MKIWPHKDTEVIMEDETFDALVEARISVYRKDGGAVVTYFPGHGEVPLGECVIGCIPGFVVDHTDRNKSNNLRSNLRHLTKAANVHNAVKKRRGESGFIGVFKRTESAFRVKIVHEGRPLHYGTYRTAKEAALVYDSEVTKLHPTAPTNKSLGLL